MMKSKIEIFLELLEKEEYFLAHEVLEELWFPRRFEKTPFVQLLRGCINAAVSFELYKRGRVEPSQKVYKNFLKYKDNLHFVDSELCDIMQQCIAGIEKKYALLYNCKKN